MQMIDHLPGEFEWTQHATDQLREKSYRGALTSN